MHQGSLLDPPITFAHRGARAQAPDNTIEAFRLALHLGARGLESDVWLTADDVAVLDHDGVVKRGRRKRPIREVARADLPAHIPSLEDLFRECGTAFELSLDLKDPAAVDRVVEVARASDPSMASRLWICDHELGRTLAHRSRHPDIRIVDSTRLHRMRDGVERRAAQLADGGIDAVNLRREDWTGGLVALFHRFGVLAFGWDLQLDHQLREARRIGLDAVYSDHVDVMHDVFG